MKQIIIAPHLMHENLLKRLRKDDPFQDIKLYSKDSFLNQVYYQYDERALVYLMDHYGYDDEIAEKYLGLMKKILITSSSNPKIQKLINLRDELIKEKLLFKNDLFKHQLNISKIKIFEYTKDDEIMNFVHDATFVESNNPCPNYYCFETNQDELFFVFNKIRELINSGVNPSDISIYGLSSDDELITHRMAKNFKININHFYPKTFFSLSYVRDFLFLLEEHSVDESLSIVKEICGGHDTFVDFEELVKIYKLTKENKKHQIELYKSIFNRKYLREEQFLSAVNVVSEPIAKENGYLFITNFLQGKYPITKRDTEYLSNIEKVEAQIITTDKENTANLGYFTNLLRQNAHLFVSYSKRSFSGNLLKSPLIESLKLREQKSEFSVVNSVEEARIQFATLKDYMNNYLQDFLLLQRYIKSGLDIDYRTYDSQVQKIDHFFDFGIVKLSYSSMKAYRECAFKYYLGHILKIDDFEENYTLLLGQIAHNIFEHIDELRSCSFDEVFEKYRSLENDKFQPYDWIFFERSKKDLKKAAEFILKFESQITNPKILREKRIEYNATEHVVLEGRLDKAIFSGDNQEYLTVIDYKTGNEHFDESSIIKGFSLQLPIYSLLLNKCYSNKEPIGLFIEKVLPDGIVKSVDENEDNESLLLKGVFLDNRDKVATIDSSIKEFDVKSQYIKSCTVKNDVFDSRSRSRNKEWFERNSQIAEDYVKSIGQDIYNNKYFINPKIIKGKNVSCDFCPFKDICFLQPKEFVNLDNGKEETMDD